MTGEGPIYGKRRTYNKARILDVAQELTISGFGI